MTEQTQPLNPRYKRLLELRHMARTDPRFVLDQILGYKDVHPDVHGPILDALPKFIGGKDELLTNGQIRYTPGCDVWHLQGVRKRLFLYPRGHLKTSIITQGGIIMWLLNFPNIRILLTTATADLAHVILKEIKSHFQYNESLRALFPEYCPNKSIKDWGNAESFSLPNRNKIATREDSVSVSSVGKTIAGQHFEVLMCSDMVDKENIKTPGGIRDVIDHYNYMDPLLERHQVDEGSKLPNHGWITVEGTSYSFADLYSKLLNDSGFRLSEFGPGVETRETEDWKIVHGDAEVDAVKQTTLWPARFPWAELKKMERTMGPSIYSAQMRNRPMSDEGGLIDEQELMRNRFWFDDSAIRKIKDTLRIHTTIDVAGMETSSRGDYTVINTAGFDRDGRCYVLELRRGHLSPTEVINHIFDVHRLWNPIDMKIEKEAHSRVLGHFLRREMSKRQVFPNIVDLKRDNHTSKVQRIKGLEPWFAAGVIRFHRDIAFKTDLVREIVEFPSSKHDDILDTIADQMQNREGGVNIDVISDGKEPYDPFAWNPVPTFQGFDPITHEATLLWDRAEQSTENYDAMTGI